MCRAVCLERAPPVDVELSLGELVATAEDPDPRSRLGGRVPGWTGRAPCSRPFASRLLALGPMSAEPSIRSDTVLSHIRHATQGAIALANTQPFVRELWARAHVFAHNGHLGEGIVCDHAVPHRFEPIGETDSEIAFCVLMDQLAATVDPRTNEEIDPLFATFAAFAREMREHGPANIIYASDGRLLVHADRRTQRPGVIEPPGLWLLQRQCPAQSQSMFAGAGVSVAGTALSVALIASVPLTSESWQPLDRGTVLELRKGYVVAQQVV